MLRFANIRYRPVTTAFVLRTEYCQLSSFEGTNHRHTRLWLLNGTRYIYSKVFRAYICYHLPNISKEQHDFHPDPPHLTSAGKYDLKTPPGTPYNNPKEKLMRVCLVTYTRRPSEPMFFSRHLHFWMASDRTNFRISINNLKIFQSTRFQRLYL